MTNIDVDIFQANNLAMLYDRILVDITIITIRSQKIQGHKK